jgi:hypothetical protein
MVYELRKYALRYSHQRDYLDTYANVVAPRLDECGHRLIGAWMTYIGTGVRSDVHMLLQWVSVEAQVDASRSLREQQWYPELARAEAAHVSAIDTTFLELFAFSPENWAPPQPDTTGHRIYELRNYSLKYGQLDDWIEDYEKNFGPSEECGFRTLGVWQPITGHGVGSHVISLLQWDDLGHRETAYNNVLQQPWYQLDSPDYARVSGHVEDAQIRIMAPLSFSPLR